MQRSDFLKAMLHTAVAAPVALAAGSDVAAKRGPDTSFRGKRMKTDYSYDLPAAPEKVFPLLCPVLEYDWIDIWDCRLIYTDSGVAEENCVFTTNFDNVPMTWTTSRYEPSRRIEYIAMSPERYIMHLTIRLEPAPGGAKVHWSRVFTSLSAAMNHNPDNWTVEKEKALGAKLEHYLRTGKMLSARQG